MAQADYTGRTKVPLPCGRTETARVEPSTALRSMQFINNATIEEARFH